MSIDEALDYFGNGARICRALNIHRKNYTNWRKRGYIPMKHQVVLKRLIEDNPTPYMDIYL